MIIQRKYAPPPIKPSKEYLYDVCLTCGYTDAPFTGTCMTCYMRGKPSRMQRIYETEEE